MRYLSLFSGVEMAGLALIPLGWELVAVAEVDEFASAVIAHHHPYITNLGDVQSVTDGRVQSLGRVDVVIGGFPCQDLSHAGKRKGLRNSDGTVTRSGLFFDAMRLVRASGARWLILENVPGLFSSNGGRDFGAVLAEILGCTFAVPKDGWQSAGAATGPGGGLCWRTLDAQWFGLAQRRERVFVVADFGNGADSEKVFPLLESVPRHPPACVAARQKSARRTTGGARSKSIWEQIAGAFRYGAAPRPASIARTIGAVHGGADEHDAEAGRLIPMVTPILEPTKRAGKKGSRKDGSGLGSPGDPMFTLQAGAQHGVALAFGGNDTSGPRDISSALSAKGGVGRMDFESETFVVSTSSDIAHTLTGGGFDASEDGTGRGKPIIAVNARQDPDVLCDLAHALGRQHNGMDNGIVFDTTQITSADNRSNPKAGDTGHPLSATAHPPAYATRYEVRRLMPVECEKLQGVPVGYTAVPWRGGVAADGPRYRALGNGFAVPCIEWIGRRIKSSGGK